MKEFLKQYKKTILLWTVVFAVGVPLLAYGIGRFQFHKAEKKVEQKVGAESFLLDFSSPAVIDSQSALLTQLWNLIDQEEKTRTAMNSAYGFTEEDYSQLTGL